MSKEFFEVVNCIGASFSYLALTEANFVSASGSAYAPPERGDWKRLTSARQIQFLQDCPGVVETFQTSAAEVFLPCNSIGGANDAGDGRIIWFKNSGTGSITVKDYAGNPLWIVKQFGIIVIVGNDNNNWDFYFTAKNIDFNNATNGFTSDNVQGAIEEVKTYGEGFPRAGVPLSYNGTISTGSWISYTELIATPRILFPVKIRIKEITWVNTNVNLGSFTFEFYKNGQVNPTNLVYTYTPTVGDRAAGRGYSSELSIDFDAGDSLFLRYVKPSGTSLSDLGFILWIARWG